MTILAKSPASNSMIGKRRPYGSALALVTADPITLPSKNFKWPKAKVKALGLWMSTDSDMSASWNYNLGKTREC